MILKITISIVKNDNNKYDVKFENSVGGERSVRYKNLTVEDISRKVSEIVNEKDAAGFIRNK